MIQFEYKVLCSSEHTCGQVMQAMKKMDFEKVERTKRSAESDHSAILKAKNADDAHRKADQLMSKFKGKIYDITVLPVN